MPCPRPCPKFLPKPALAITVAGHLVDLVTGLRRAGSRRWPAPVPTTQLYICVRVWARFYRSPKPASSRSCRARRWRPSRPARSRPRRSAGPVGRACGSAARAPTATIDGKLQPLPPNSRILFSSSSATSFSVRSGRSEARSTPNARSAYQIGLADLGDLVLVLDQPQISRPGSVVAHQLDLGQRRGDLVAQRHGHRVALDRPACRPSPGRPPGRSRSSMPTPGRPNRGFQPGHSSLELGRVARVADHDFALVERPADSCRRR